MAIADREAVDLCALEAARRELARPLGDQIPNIAELDARLQQAAADLRESLLNSFDAPPALVDGLEVAYEISALRDGLRSRDLADRLHVLGQIRESMATLAACSSPQELIEAAPGELCWACGFTRALVSQIRGSSWVPQVYEAAPGSVDPSEDGFRGWLSSVEIPLDHMLLETELVRRRMPALVTDPETHPRTNKDIVRLGHTNAYVVSPIIPAGRAIGFFHADRYGQEHEVTEEDRDNIWAFSEQFAAVYHRAVLAERLQTQRAHLREAFADTERLFDDLREAEIELGQSETRHPETEAPVLFRPSASRLDGLLTRREREVLELITSGATNMMIAERLVLSEGTVKSHVKHILRKLRVGNRAEAVARYLQIVRYENRSS